jgi:hypothetical protein
MIQTGSGRGSSIGAKYSRKPLPPTQLQLTILAYHFPRVKKQGVHSRTPDGPPCAGMSPLGALRIRAATGSARPAQASKLGFAIYFGFAIPMSAAQKGLASSWEAKLAYPAHAEIFLRLHCALLTCASAKTPGSIWPVPGQRVYEQIPVQGTNEEDSPTSCVPPREEALYHRALSQVCCDTPKFHDRWTFWHGNGINVNGNHPVGG